MCVETFNFVRYLNTLWNRVLHRQHRVTKVRPLSLLLIEAGSERAPRVFFNK